MKKILYGLEAFLENLNHKRDEFLFLFIKPYWPRKITPNQLTCLRLIIGFILIILIFFSDVKNKPLILSFFCVGLITDLFDGSVARGLNKVTELGAFLDPMADKLLILPVAVYSLYELYMPLLVFFLFTEIINVLASLYYKSKGINIGSNIYGKTKMVLLSLVFVAILVTWPKPPSLFFIYVIWLSLFFSYLSIFTKLLEPNDKKYAKLKNP